MLCVSRVPARHFILIHVYLVVFLGCLNGVEFWVMSSSLHWFAFVQLWPVRKSRTVISTSCTPLRSPVPGNITLSPWALSLPPPPAAPTRDSSHPLEQSRLVVTVSSPTPHSPLTSARLPRCSLGTLPAQSQSPGRGGEPRSGALRRVPFRPSGPGQQLTCLWFPSHR